MLGDFLNGEDQGHQIWQGNREALELLPVAG
jgi:hypothetical protein